jgi:hypothetical protein
MTNKVKRSEEVGKLCSELLDESLARPRSSVAAFLLDIGASGMKSASFSWAVDFSTYEWAMVAHIALLAAEQREREVADPNLPFLRAIRNAREALGWRAMPVDD